MPPYLLERQTEYWTSRAVEDYFMDAGCEVLTFPLSQLSERHLPADYLFYSAKFAKIFGLQYKRLYGNGEDYWEIGQRQLDDLQVLGDWVFYSLSELRKGREHRLALHKQVIVAPDRMPRTRRLDTRALRDVRYFRWGGFVRMLEDCRAGRRVDDDAGLRAALEPLCGRRDDEIEAIIDVFAVGFEQRRVLHLSPFLTPSDEPDDPPGNDFMPRRRRG